MKPAYRIPDNDCACVEPVTPATKRHDPIGRFNVRSFITSVQDGRTTSRPAAQMAVRGIAFDGGQGIREVAYSTDRGRSLAREPSWATISGGTPSASSPSASRFHKESSKTLRVRAWEQDADVESRWRRYGSLLALCAGWSSAFRFPQPGGQTHEQQNRGRRSGSRHSQCASGSTVSADAKTITLPTKAHTP